MECYQCGNRLGTGDHCPHCGADVRIYRRIVHLSNSYYNAGLEKARVRDLTGAAEALNRSLQLNKRNTDARNLLGLIYFETGEVVEAICQWVASKDMKPLDNLADEYLDRVHDSRNQMESMNQAVKKFNQALVHAGTDSVDLAVIQLKRVIKQQPRLIKAYQLLALLYMHQEEYQKANKVLKQALKRDAGNTLCLKYAAEVQDKLGWLAKADEEEKEKPESEEPAQTFFAPEPPDREDVLAPAYRERPGGVRAFLWVLTGIAIALCMYQFVILRTKNRDENVRINQEIAAYDSKLSDKELEVAALQSQLKTLQEENSNLEESLGALTGDSGTGNQYDALLNVVSQYISGDGKSDTMAAAFSRIDGTAVDSEAFRKVYEELKSHLAVDKIADLYEEAYRLYKGHYYKKAIPVFEQCLEQSPDHVDSLYYLAFCYKKRKNPEGALACYMRIAEEFPNSEYYDSAVKEIKALGGTVPETQKAQEEEAEADAEEDGEDGAEE